MFAVVLPEYNNPRLARLCCVQGSTLVSEAAKVASQQRGVVDAGTIWGRGVD